jgi:twitching motility protein PilT
MRSDEKSRALAFEILICTNAVRNVIKTKNSQQLNTLIQTGAEYGMISMDKSLKNLLDNRVITYKSAAQVAKNIDEFAKL